MNKKILTVLEFERIRQQLAGFTVTEAGKTEASQLEPVNQSKEIKRWLAETADAANILRLKGGIPLPKLENIRPHMKRVEIGASLNGSELAQISRVLSTTGELVKFFATILEEQLELTYLYEWSEQLVVLPELTRQLKLSLDEDGYVTDEASQELRTLRNQIRRSEQNIREQLDNLIRGKQARYLSDALVTMRNERYVIPVKAEYRNQFGGVVHDQSASGQTLFIEPRQIVELNNRLRQQQIAERREIERILAELSAELEPHRHEILHNAFVLGKLDFIQAKALLARQMKAVIPQVSLENDIYFRQARHPLIDQAVVVPNDLQIGKDYQAVVITGPNTGGKTLTLKTLGLLQVMGQAGLAIPAAEDSRMGIFTEIFADIGDEQSIEQSLSTFSSHMTNLVTILNRMDKKCLLLLDELGAGTDPQEGAALAIAILDAVGQAGAYVMATTHYPELKVYGYNRSGTINASMEFDVDTLRPTYRLLIGVPGRSNAFEISERLGLNLQVIQAARRIIDGESQDLNGMIADLESRQKMAETEYLEMREYVEEADQLYQDLRNAYSYFYEEREKELETARQKANQLISEAEERAEQIIADIRNMQLRSGQSGTVKEHELIAAKSQLNNLRHEEEHLAKNKVLQKAKKQKQFKPGDEVLVNTYGQRGILLTKQGSNKWQVQLGILKMSIAEEDLTLVAAEPLNEPKQKINTVRSANAAHVSTQLDLRGKRYEDALHEVDQYLDAAILAGYPQVTIVHGKGTGALREGITNYLKNHRSVKSFEFAPANQGGNGATIVHFG